MFKNVNLGRIAGIPIQLHWTFLLLLVYVASSALFKGKGLESALLQVSYVGAIFSFVVLHELGHALTARRFGIQTGSITLLPIGGVAGLKSDPPTPKAELLISLAGPAVNFVLVGIFISLAMWQAPTHQFKDALYMGTIWIDFMAINLTLGLFNLIPAFPMDGGRILRAILQFKMPRLPATEWAVKFGKIIAVAGVVFGFYYNPMLILIAIFIWMAGTSEVHSLRLRAMNQGLNFDKPYVFQSPIYAKVFRQFKDAGAFQRFGSHNFQSSPFENPGNQNPNDSENTTPVNPWTQSGFSNNVYPKAKMWAWRFPLGRK